MKKLIARARDDMSLHDRKVLDAKITLGQHWIQVVRGISGAKDVHDYNW